MHWRLKVITTLRWPSRAREGTRSSCLCWSPVVPILSTETRRVSESHSTIWLGTAFLQVYRLEALLAWDSNTGHTKRVWVSVCAWGGSWVDLWNVRHFSPYSSPSINDLSRVDRGADGGNQPILAVRAEWWHLSGWVSLFLGIEFSKISHLSELREQTHHATCVRVHIDHWQSAPHAGQMWSLIGA